MVRDIRIAPPENVADWFLILHEVRQICESGRGFVGGFLASLPESELGLVVALLFPGLGTFALLPVTIIGRVLEQTRTRSTRQICSSVLRRI